MQHRFYTILVCWFLFIPVCFSQVVWECPLVEKNIQVYDSLKTKIKLKNHEKLANAVLQYFPLNDDKLISYQYIIKCNQEVNIEEVSECLAQWYKIRMPRINPRKDGMVNHLSGAAILNRIGAAAGYMNPTFISAEEEVTIDIKEDRIRVTLTIPRYMSSSPLSGTQYYSPGAMFPANQKGIHKDGYALAFIICNSTIINDAKDILEFINKSMNKKEDVDW